MSLTQYTALYGPVTADQQDRADHLIGKYGHGDAINAAGQAVAYHAKTQLTWAPHLRHHTIESTDQALWVEEAVEREFYRHHMAGHARTI